MKVTKHNLIDFIASMTAIISLAISIKACSSTNESNKIAKEALETSRRQFFQEKRPFVVIKPRMISNTSWYYDIVADRSKRDIEFIVTYLVENIGNVAAVKLTPFRPTFFPNLKMGGEIHYDFPGNMVIGPGDNVVIVQKIKITLSDLKGFDNLVKQHNTNKGIQSQWQFRVTYENEIDTTLKYSSSIFYELEKSDNKIMKTEINLISK